MTLFNVPRERRDGTFLGVHNPFENPTIPLSSVGLDEVFGSVSTTDSGESVTTDSCLQIPTMFRCLDLLSTVVAGCPLRCYKNPGKNEIDARILESSDVNLYTQYELWKLVMIHLGLWGNAYIMKVRDPMDRIIDLRPISPDIVEPKLDDQGNKIFLVKQLNGNGTEKMGAPPVVKTDWEIMHIMGFSVDGFKGLSPVQYSARTLGTSIASDKLAAKFYNKGTVLSGVINVKAPLSSQEQADEIRRRWLAKNGGIAHTAEVAVLDAETQFQQLTIPPDALQFLESRRWQTTEIARWFGIPPHLVGDVEKSTSWGSGIEEQNTAFVSYTISHYTNTIAQRVTKEVIRTNKQFCEFDLQKLLRGDTIERYQAYALGIQWGFITRNEARNEENKQPLDGLDLPLVPMNMSTGNPDDVLAPEGAGQSPTVGGNGGPSKGKGTPATKGGGSTPNKGGNSDNKGGNGK